MSRQCQTSTKAEAKPSVTPAPSRLLQSSWGDRDASQQTQPAETPPILHEALNLPIRATNHPIIQPKLMLGAVGDKYEQEADRVAAQVVSQIHAPQASAQGETVQRQENEKGKLRVKPLLQCKSGTDGVPVTPELEAKIGRSRSGGQPLAESIRTPMERSFGADFSGVRVHTDVHADQLNQLIQAKAFTTKQNIFFSRGEYDPTGYRGQTVIAHELTHTLQQRTPVQQAPSIVQRLMTRAQFAGSTQPKIGRRGKHNAALYNAVDPLLQTYATLDPNDAAHRQQRMNILYSIEHAIYAWVRTKPHFGRDSKHRQVILNLLNDVQSEHQNQIVQVSAPGARGAANELFIGDPNLTPLQHQSIQVLWDSLRNDTGVIEITETCAQSYGMPLEQVPGFRNQMLALFARLLASPTGRSLIDEILKGKNGGVANADPTKDLITVRPLRAAEIAMGRTIGAAGVKAFGPETINPDQTRKDGIGSSVTYGHNLTETDAVSRLQNNDPLLTPVFIGFGHELIHALHNLRGVNQKDMPITANLRAIWSNPEERATIEPIAGHGVQGVPGIPGIISENQLRRDHGLPLRDSHH